MDNAMKKLTASQTVFEKENDPECFREALEAIESEASQISIEERGSPRRQAVGLWIELLATLYKHMNPDWNPKEVPDLNLIPPPSGDVQFPSGVDPAVIKDPTARNEYETRLEANRAKAEAYSIQLKLRRLDELASQSAQRFVELHFDPTEAEQNELEEMLNQSPITERHKQLLRSAVSKR